MSIIDGVVLNIIFILFPLTIYTIYLSYLTAFHKEEKEIYLDFALISSIFLLIRYTNSKYLISSLMFINVPLLTAYIKNRKNMSIILSVVIATYIGYYLNIHIYYILIEYLIYFLIYNLVVIKKADKDLFTNIFIMIKCFVLSFELFFLINPTSNFIISILTLIFLLIILILGIKLILSLIKKGDSIIEINNILKELEKQKALKVSLLKITHEVKNPIAVCKGYLEMMDYKDEKKLKKYLPIINNEINRTLSIIDDFSDYGKLKIEKDIVDISLLLEDALGTLKPLFDSKNIKIEFNALEEEFYMNLDYNRIKQVLVNILKNAIEAKKERKRLIITVNTKITKKYVNIIITDTGIGMDKETLSKMSNIFYTTKRNGTGLGVALSKEIVILHGGNIKYKSTLGKGTTVTIKLPIKE